MRILHVITTMQTGGAERLMVDLLPRLRDKGHHVELAVFDGANTPFMEELVNSGIKVNSLSIGGSVYNPLYILKLVFLMRNFDIVHTHNTSSQFFVSFASYFTKNILFTTEHNTTNRRRKWPFFKLFDCWMYNRYKVIICISDQASINLNNYLGHICSRIDTIYNGVDVEKYLAASPNKEILELFSGYKLVTMVAGFRKQKDQATLIRSLKYLNEKIHILLVGDGETKPDIVKLIKDQKCGDRVHLLGIRTDVPSILKSSDIIVMSSHYEGLSLSNIEGMASGRPFVASNVDGLKEITEGYGVLFPDGDDKTLSSIILRLVSDKVYYDSVVKKCIERALQYDIEKMVEKYNCLYNEFYPTSKI